MYKKIKKPKLLWINNAINYLVYVDVFMITKQGDVEEVVYLRLPDFSLSDNQKINLLFRPLLGVIYIKAF